MTCLFMACNRNLYAPNAKIEKKKLSLNFGRYSNNGASSKLIKN